MKTAEEHRREIRAIIEANRRAYVAQRIADILESMHTDALEVA